VFPPRLKTAQNALIPKSIHRCRASSRSAATTRDPSERLAEANASDTWRPPHPYVVVCAVEVADAFASERAVHAVLAARRVGAQSAQSARREFFEITEPEARVLLSLLAVAAETETIATNAQAAPPRVIHAAALGAREPDPDPPPDPPVAALRPWSAEGKLRAWVERNYTHVPLREKDSGTRLEALYTAYATTVPPVHTKTLGRNKFAAMLNSVYPNVGPHRSCAGTVNGLYLLR
jgi:hypothetical protein